MNLPESSHAPTFVPLRPRHTRRTHRAFDHLLLVAGVWLACVVTAVLLLQDRHRHSRAQPSVEVAAPAQDAATPPDAAVGEFPWSTDRSGHRTWLSDGGRTSTNLLLERFADASPAASR